MSILVIMIILGEVLVIMYSEHRTSAMPVERHCAHVKNLACGQY